MLWVDGVDSRRMSFEKSARRQERRSIRRERRSIAKAVVNDEMVAGIVVQCNNETSHFVCLFVCFLIDRKFNENTRN